MSLPRSISKGIFIVLTFSISGIFLASLYGALHNQISYSISPEYFTKFKFVQFKMVHFHGREGAALIGVFSTWWFGLILGIIIGLSSLVFSSLRSSLKFGFWSMFLAIGIAIIFGLTGLLLGQLVFSESNINWHLFAEIENRRAFLAAGSMHNFSYLGGVMGTLFAIIYQIRIKRKA